MKTFRIFAAAAALAGALAAQQIQLNLDQLAAKATDTIDIALNRATLRFAAKFLSDSDPDEAAVKKLVAGLEGIYVKGYKFKSSGAYSQADVDKVRAQLKAPEWTRIVGVKSAEDGETDEVYLRNDANDKITAIAIIAAEPTELTVVNIVGPVDLDSLAELGGHFGVPKLVVPPRPPRKK